MFGFLDGAAEWFSSPKAIKQSAHDTVASASHSAAEMIDDIGRGFESEGLFGLADPLGMLDRADAKRDLAPYFAISPDDFDGPHKSNEVTEDEFEAIAREYSDIRRGRGDLSIVTDRIEDPDEAQDYRNDRMHDIAMLLRTQSGREQIEFLNNAPDDAKTTIQPRMHSDGTQAPDAACEKWSEKENRIYLSDVQNKGGIPNDDGIEHVILAHEMEHSRQMIMNNEATGTSGIAGDDYFTENREMQTAGLVQSDATHPSDPTAATENRIRWELNQLGEDWLPRTHYDVTFADIEGVEHNDKKRNSAWRDFLTSALHPGFD